MTPKMTTSETHLLLLRYFIAFHIERVTGEKTSNDDMAEIMAVIARRYTDADKEVAPECAAALGLV